MINEIIPYDRALAEAAEYPYIWAIKPSEVIFGKNSGQLCLDELLEARCFGPNEGEIHFYRDDTGEWQAVKCLEEGNDSTIDKQRDLLSAFGKALTVRQIIDYDEDGQAYIKAVRMVKWEGGNV